MDYLGIYGLNEPPFLISPNPRFLYLAAQHRAAIAKVVSRLQTRQGLATVYGALGTGKTTIARYLHDRLNDDPSGAYLVRTIYSPAFRRENQLLRAVLREFGVEGLSRTYEGNLALFQDFLQRQVIGEDRTVVLVIDEANLLPAALLEFLRQCLNYENETMKLLQIVLFGADELREKVRRKPALASRVRSISTLEPFDAAELEQMIAFRLSIAGRRQPLFTEEALALLYELSEGVPRTALNLCEYACEAAAAVDAPLIDAPHILLATSEVERPTRSRLASARPRPTATMGV